MWADDIDDFATAEHSTSVKILSHLLEDPVLRVRSHACCALCNIFENSNKDIIVLHSKEIIPKLFYIISNAT